MFHYKSERGRRCESMVQIEQFQKAQCHRLRCLSLRMVSPAKPVLCSESAVTPGTYDCLWRGRSEAKAMVLTSVQFAHLCLCVSYPLTRSESVDLFRLSFNCLLI